MHTISAMARNASVPRRTVQYWHDRAIIKPASLDPVVYGDDELVLVRILASFAGMKPAIGVLSSLAAGMRLAIADDGCVPERVRLAFAAARARKEAYLLTAADVVPDEDFWPRIVGVIGDHRNLGAALYNHLVAMPNLGWTVANLTYCFDTSLSTGMVHQEKVDD